MHTLQILICEYTFIHILKTFWGGWEVGAGSAKEAASTLDFANIDIYIYMCTLEFRYIDIYNTCIHILSKKWGGDIGAGSTNGATCTLEFRCIYMYNTCIRIFKNIMGGGALVLAAPMELCTQLSLETLIYTTHVYIYLQKKIEGWDWCWQHQRSCVHT